MTTFAITGQIDSNIVKCAAKAVKTKRWVKGYIKHLGRCAERLTTANTDNRQVIGSMLHCAYGVNIGEQVLTKLSDDHLIKIKSNIISIYYS